MWKRDFIDCEILGRTIIDGGLLFTQQADSIRCLDCDFFLTALDASDGYIESLRAQLVHEFFTETLGSMRVSKPSYTLRNR
ncbi:hypothetical protein UB43_27410 [Pseudomonas sp. 21]|nr:hypothetical protein UB43_27410 [Pseudomonas sp. 21]